MGHVQEYRYRVVDVFTEHPLEGNALAVFLDASAMDATTMQRVARELNLAETAFILPPTRTDCAARVRRFTPRGEHRSGTGARRGRRTAHAVAHHAADRIRTVL